MTVISLLTDFGLKDGNVGVMKGVILGLAPHARLIDLGHLIPPQDMREAAILLGRSAPYFPDGSIHLVVVDPGVGTWRRPMAGRLGTHFFVGPDNGVVTKFLEYAEARAWPTAFVELNRPERWLAEVSPVFHGRDIFSPTAAHLANGVAMEDLGDRLLDPVRLALARPEAIPGGWRGKVDHIDYYGNVRSNIRREHVEAMGPLVVRLRGATIEGLVRTFGDRAAGELIALYGSTGDLVVALVNGNAAQRLGAVVGDPVEVLGRESG
ncbi:MAG TPA: SAM-dependent chlorinase/fluorinase [Anaerolineales bacterium]|nr:SAM-dependent chlorinase/fluorinase [Anaerolineales bacterium]